MKLIGNLSALTFFAHLIFAGACSFNPFGAPARAEYLSAKPNHDLRVELEGDDQRLMPKSNWFAIALDADVTYRAPNVEFYHGVGHWTQLRTETQVHPLLRLNSRSIFYAGSMSEGYSHPLGEYHLLKVTGVTPFSPLNAPVEVTAGDLDRRNLGSGLLIQDRETNGVRVIWSPGAWRFRVTGDGTGALSAADDTLTAEWSYAPWADRPGAAGLALAAWPAGDQSKLPHNRAPYFSAFGELPLAKLRLNYEWGIIKGFSAAMVSIAGDYHSNNFGIRGRGEARHYQNHFADEWVGYTNQTYVSLDQLDKPFTNAINLFTFDDNVSVYAIHADFWYRVTPRMRLSAQNELGIFQFRARKNFDFYFYRFAVDYLPFEGREDTFSVYASDKFLSDSYARPPDAYSTASKPLFQRINSFGADATFRF